MPKHLVSRILYGRNATIMETPLVMNPSKPYKSHSSCQWWVDDDNKRILAEVAFITRNVPIITLTSPMIGEFYHPWESWSPKKSNQKTRWTVLITFLWILSNWHQKPGLLQVQLMIQIIQVVMLVRCGIPNSRSFDGFEFLFLMENHPDL